MKLSHRLLAWITTVVILSGVFALYLQPHFLFTLAQQVWSCF